MIQQLINFTAIVSFFLFPLFFLPITPESYEVNKMLLLIITSLILFVLITIKIVQRKKIVFVKSSFGLLFFLLAGVTLSSSLLQSPNITNALTTPLSTGTILSGFLFYLILVNTINKYSLSEAGCNFRGAHTECLNQEHKQSLTNGILKQVQDDNAVSESSNLALKKIASASLKEGQLMFILILDAVLLSFFVIFLYAGLLPENPYTPAGNLLTTASFFAIMALYTFMKMIEKLKWRNRDLSEARCNFRGAHTEGLYQEYQQDKSNKILKQVQDDNAVSESSYLALKKITSASLKSEELVSEDLPQIKMYILSLIPILIALTILIFQLTTSQKPLILPFLYGGKIFLEILRNIKTLLLGIGPSNFITAFTLTKPAGINTTPFWNVTFTSSSSYFMNLATETGLVAAFLYLFILLKAARLLINKLTNPSSSIHHPSSSIYLITLLFTLLLQILLPSGMTVFILTVILLAFAAEKEPVEIKLGNFSYLLILPAALFILPVSYFTGRWYLSEVAFKKSLDAFVNNQGTETYNWQKEAVALNPASDRYHLTLSQTSFRLANALSAKKELTNDDKQNIPKLVQQSIEEAQLAVQLYHTNIANWNNLAQIYTSLINFAAESEKWALESQKQKILLDPNNPNHRIALGRLYFSLKNYNEAENLLQQALSLKPDLSQTHFLLAAVFKEQKKYKEAYSELQITQSLVPSDSEDAAKVEEEISKLDAGY